MPKSQFQTEVTSLLEKYRSTPLVERLQEAISFGRGARAQAYWIRDDEHVVNIVWLAADGVRDVTFMPGPPVHTMFDYLPKGSISTVEIQESDNISQQFGFSVPGNFIAVIFTTAGAPRVGWIAGTESQKRDLVSFVQRLLKSI